MIHYVLIKLRDRSRPVKPREEPTVSPPGVSGRILAESQALRGDRSAQLGFILFTLAAPLLLVVIVSLAWSAFRWFHRGR